MTQSDQPKQADAELSPLKRAFLALEKAQSRVEQLERAQTEPIAVIGVGCRLPGDEDGVNGYWRLLEKGASAVSRGAGERFSSVRPEGEPDRELPEAARWAALLRRIDLFDPQHFGISPREATGIDPQQRLLLEVSWEALENGGIDPLSTYRSPTGVYLGISTNDYSKLQFTDVTNPHFASGVAPSVASGRISYVLGLNGPSVSIDTACSSSLVAVHLACEGLYRGDCEMAIAGGVNLIMIPEPSIAFAHAGMLSPHGNCKAFYAGADGYVRGEGCGLVVLKRLSAAERDGDRILGVILGSAVNQDGASSGLTVPNGLAQQAVIRRALERSGVEPWQVGYVEAHGTGTALGDPIEAEALGAVFGDGKREGPLLIGSVKTNVGHLESAAGVAGLIKVVLGLGEGKVAAQLHWERPSEHVRWSELGLEVVTKEREWERIGGRRIGGVSSFGFSGTNAHVVVEGWDEKEVAGGGEREAEVLVLTARTEGGLRDLCVRYAEYLAVSDARWCDICHTAAVGRGVFGERLAVVAGTKEEASAQLRGWLGGRVEAGVHVGRVRAGSRVRVGLFAAGAERALEWDRRLREWGIEPVPAGATLAVTAGGVKTELPAIAAGEDFRSHAGVLAELFVRGAAIAWPGWEGSAARRRVALPTYAFQRERYWVTGSRAGEEALLPGRRLRAAGVLGQYELELDGEAGWVSGHRVEGRPVLPATGHLELMRTAGAAALGSLVEVEDALLQSPLVVGVRRRVQTVLEEAAEDGRHRVRVYGEPAAEEQRWELVSEGWVRKAEEAAGEDLKIEATRERLGERLDVEEFYAEMERHGMGLDGRFRGLRELWWGPDETLGRIGSLAGEQDHGMTPWRLDACLQMVGAKVLREERGGLYLPMSVSRYRLFTNPSTAGCWSLVRARRTDSSTFTADLLVANEDGQPIAQLDNVQFRKRNETRSDKPANYRIRWDPKEILTKDGDANGSRLAEGKTSPVRSALLLGTPEQVEELREQLRELGVDTGSAGAEEARELLSSASAYEAIVYFPEALAQINTLEPGEITQQSGKACGPLLSVVQALLQSPLANKPRLYVVTESICATGRDGAEIHMLGTPLAGMLRAIALEAQELRCTHIDLGAETGDRAARITRELMSRNEERRVAFRGGQRLVARLERMPSEEQASHSAESPMHLSTKSAVDGVVGIETLTYVPTERREPAADEVEISVRAATVNFRDVLKTTGVLDHAGDIGTDCSGIVVRSGAGVTQFKPGDEVAAIAPSCFDTYVIAAQELMIKKPPELSFDEMAGQTIAYLTADFCLNQLAHIQKGQRVLIHAAAGGVGLAAVQLAKKAGAEIIATAGSEEKRNFLRNLGIEQIFNSRSVDFREQIKGGVDIVLNSLTGAAIDAGLSLLRPNGVFVELGKTDVRQAESVRREWPTVRYVVADLTPVFAARSPWVQERLIALTSELAGGTLPLLPVMTFERQEIKQAFRYVAAAKHIGRVVVRSGENTFSNGVHLITGGLRGIGLRLAEWLAARGARDLLLIGRQAPGPEAADVIEKIRSNDVTVNVVQGDIAQFAVAQAAVREAGKSLRGVWHCAGVLDNVEIAGQSWDRMSSVLRPKIDGAWNLHTLTHGMKLEYFVLFSSWASIAGSRAQLNHCTANAFLDGLAVKRRSEGLPALSVNWGAWRDVGAAATETFQRHLERSGMEGMRPADALDALEVALRSRDPQIAIAAIRWNKYLSGPSATKGDCFYEEFSDRADRDGNADRTQRAEMANAAVRPTAAVAGLADLLQLPTESRRKVIHAKIEDLVRNTLDLSRKEEVDPDGLLSDLGMDSLLAVELRNGLSSCFARRMPSSLLFDYPTVRSLGRFVEQEIVSSTGAVQTKKAVVQQPGLEPTNAKSLSILDEIEMLSDEEVDEIFEKGDSR